MKKLVIICLAFTSCSKTIYLSTEGVIEEIHEKHIRIVFPCENIKRSDCLGYSDFSKEQFPFAYVGQKVKITTN